MNRGHRGPVIAAFAACSLALSLWLTPAADAAELKVMSSVALSATLDELKPAFEASTGHKLRIVYGLIADIKKRMEAGEPTDVVIVSRGALDDLLKQGKVADGSIANVASTYVAVAVRAGAPKPNIGTADDLKAALLKAKSISYSDPAKGGASGVHFAKVLDRLGIADQVKSKTTLVPGAQAPELVARGGAELGVAQASEIFPVAGAQLVGPLPGDLNNVTMFAAAIGATSQNAAASRALIEFMKGPTGVSLLKSKGMDPA